MKERHSTNRRGMAWFAVSYTGLLVVFWLFVRTSPLVPEFGPLLPYFFASFALLLLPFLAFGFGAADRLRELLRGRAARVLFAAVFLLPYVVFAIPLGEFRADVTALLLALSVGLAVLYEYLPPRPGPSGSATFQWQDALALLLLALAVMFRWLRGAWPHPGLGGFSKFLLLDVALYLFLVIRGLDGIGYDLRPRLSDAKIGLREWLFFAPIAIGLGLALGFLHVHRVLPGIGHFVGACLVTFLFVAVPEEFFFRGVLQNLLERRFGPAASLVVASVLFGLSHFNKRAVFNWRYVILAAIAGIFYGRAWRAERRLMASSITHTLVDVVWGIWFL